MIKGATECVENVRVLGSGVGNPNKRSLSLPEVVVAAATSTKKGKEELYVPVVKIGGD